MAFVDDISSFRAPLLSGFVEFGIPIPHDTSKRVLVDRRRVAAMVEIPREREMVDQRPRTFLMFGTAVDSEDENNGVVVLGTLDQVAQRLGIETGEAVESW